MNYYRLCKQQFVLSAAKKNLSRCFLIENVLAMVLTVFIIVNNASLVELNKDKQNYLNVSVGKALKTIMLNPN